MNIIVQLQKLNDLSESILAELACEQPKLGKVQRNFDLRQELISEWEEYNKAFPGLIIDPQDQPLLQETFQRFKEQNDEILRILDLQRFQQQKQLAVATKTRKAEDGYALF